jgi:hypothetical protein
MPDTTHAAPALAYDASAAPASLLHLVIRRSTVTLTATLPGVSESVAAAWQLTRAVVGACPRADDLVLAVSELVSNAIIHSASGESGTFTMRLRTGRARARVEIADQGPPGRPVSPRNGWGLVVVAETADQTGVTVDAEGRRSARAEVTWPPVSQRR